MLSSGWTWRGGFGPARRPGAARAVDAGDRSVVAGVEVIPVGGGVSQHEAATERIRDGSVGAAQHVHRGGRPIRRQRRGPAVDQARPGLVCVGVPRSRASRRVQKWPWPVWCELGWELVSGGLTEVMLARVVGWLVGGDEGIDVVGLWWWDGDAAGPDDRRVMLESGGGYFYGLVLVGKADAVWGKRFEIDPAEKNYGLEGAMHLPGFRVEAGQTYNAHFQLYLGPKLYHRLAQLEHNEAEVMEFGIFKIICQALLNALNTLHSFLGNYAAAILALTTIVKLSLWPLQNKATCFDAAHVGALTQNPGAAGEI